ncbi:DUF6807 family protein [Bythopirellula goksoeyrii]|uniref:Prolyl oligopeptidase family protein n=1 Tax=Bythopirellula goksoeyrii TaxID=1400387 RepID=A0A5B9Q692_9BACT|nr:DUF6807 family protein [Bythopirellula goksoeyrii]QEG33200.1 Prolyl oligopeptidase family protein [Bythopirellula goksoeyrii]
MRTLIGWCSALLLNFSVSTSSLAVDIGQQGDNFLVSIDGQEFALYDTGKDNARPFFRNVRAADGTIVSRPISPPGGDHPHHTGIWVAVDKVNDIKFWAQEGRIKNRAVEVVETGSNPAVLKVKNDWLNPNGEVVLKERTTICIFENRLLIYDIRFTTGEEPVTFGDTEEGFFAFRMADSIREEATGEIVNADGLKTAKGCWGRQSNWVDYSGQVEGRKYGVAIFDHPLNFRPGRYHVRDYGLFAINPFGEHDYTEGKLPAQPVTLPAESSLELQYGMYFHPGDVDAGNVARVYQDFLRKTESPTKGQQEIQYRSSADGTVQPAMFYAPKRDQKVPLLVALHTWSGDYKQDDHEECLQWCIEKGWVYIHPNFRGPNRNPAATGSELVIQDIEDTVTFASQHANVDPSRVYLVGTSGGGYAALLMAGRRPELWAGVSAWVPIVDLESWYYENKADGDKHWREIANSCGGPPDASKKVKEQYAKRSPITWLKNARAVNVDINAGIRDGHVGSVPVSHSLRAFNKIANEPDRLSEEEIAYFVQEAQVPDHLMYEITDPSYGDKQPLFRRQAQNVRITLFDGGHELIPQAAMNWLEHQRQVESLQQEIAN